jgi:hypothetical protein
MKQEIYFISANTNYQFHTQDFCLVYILAKQKLMYGGTFYKA